MRGVLAALLKKHGAEPGSSFSDAIKDAQNKRTRELIGMELNEPAKKAGDALKKMAAMGMAGAAVANMPGVQAAVRAAKEAEEKKVRQRILDEIEKGPKPKPTPRCPFYGFAITASLMAEQHGNQCAAMRGRYAPCTMEMEGRTPDWTTCKQKIGDLSDVRLVIAGESEYTLLEWLEAFQRKSNGK